MIHRDGDKLTVNRSLMAGAGTLELYSGRRYASDIMTHVEHLW